MSERVQQQNLILEVQLEQSQEQVQRLHQALNEYNEKYQATSERLADMAENMTTVQYQLSQANRRVSVPTWNT